MQILKIQFLKSELKNKNCSHMSRKVRFQIRYDPNNKKICSSAVSTEKLVIHRHHKLPYKLLHFNKLYLKGDYGEKLKSFNEDK